MENEVIKYENLCPVGKYLNMGSLGRFIEHVSKCKKCSKETIKPKKNETRLHK